MTKKQVAEATITRGLREPRMINGQLVMALICFPYRSKVSIQRKTYYVARRSSRRWGCGG